MPDITEPLDCYQTLKPGEPAFTLQGGDPLAELLVKQWVCWARVRAGVSHEPAGSLADLQQAALENSVADDQHEREALLIRATAAEEVAWDMRAYRLGMPSAGENPGQNPHAENSADEKARLDLHDVRVRYAQQLSSMFSTLTDMRQDLLTRGGFFCGEHDPLDNVWLSAILQLKEMSRLVEPRRLMQQSG